VLIQFKGKWNWATTPEMKADAIVVDQLSASRPSASGTNPAIFATEAITMQNPHFRVSIKSLGSWIGIGKYSMDSIILYHISKL
jgi:hypothetical protein